VGPAGQQLRLALALGSREYRALRQLGESELKVVKSKFVGGLLVEVLERGLRTRSLARRAADRKARTAPGDRHVERGLDLPQVGIERAAQPGEPLVVLGVEAHLERSRHSASAP